MSSAGESSALTESELFRTCKEAKEKLSALSLRCHKLLSGTAGDLLQRQTAHDELSNELESVRRGFFEDALERWYSEAKVKYTDVDRVGRLPRSRTLTPEERDERLVRNCSLPSGAAKAIQEVRRQYYELKEGLRGTSAPHFLDGLGGFVRY